MTTYISLLRGINVSGQKKIKMADLKKLYESLGFADVQTYIQSGNVVFKYTKTDTKQLARKITDSIRKTYSFEVPVEIRTKDDLDKIIANNPFNAENHNKLHVMFLAEKPQNPPIAEIEKMKDKSEEFFIAGREIYLSTPNGYGKSKISNTFFEKKLGVSATTRNWKTVNALFDMVKAI